MLALQGLSWTRRDADNLIDGGPAGVVAANPGHELRALRCLDGVRCAPTTSLVTRASTQPCGERSIAGGEGRSARPGCWLNRAGLGRRPNPGINERHALVS